MLTPVFVESSVAIAYCKGRGDIFNPGAVALYEKLKSRNGWGIISTTVKNEIDNKIDRLINKAMLRGDSRLANSLVFKRGRFLECVEIRKTGDLQIYEKVNTVKAILKKISIGKLQELMLKKGRVTLYPELQDLRIAAEVLFLKEEISAELFYVASTDQDFTYLLKDGLGEFGVAVDFPSSIARKL